MGSISRRLIRVVTTFFMVLAILDMAGMSNAVQMGHKVQVVMTNQFKNESLFVHCKSKDTDLGKRELKPGQKYSFRFTTNYFGTTLFFCGAGTWLHGTVQFDIYRWKRDDTTRCYYRCNWAGREDGVMGFKEGMSVPDITIPWLKL